jgi:peptide-methionine (S)-S-oxide reductase
VVDVHVEAEIPVHAIAGGALPGRAEAIPTATNHFVTGAPLKGFYLFRLGCFWGAEKRFWSIPGVIVTAVGYAGGSLPIRRMRRCAQAEPGKTRRCS